MNLQKELLAAANCHTVGEFRTKVLQYKQFNQYKEVYDQSEAHIRLIAKSSKNYSDLQRELKIHDLSMWQDEQARYEQRIDECEKKLAAIAEKRGPSSNGSVLWPRAIPIRGSYRKNRRTVRAWTGMSTIG